MLKGYKTYIVAVLAILTAVGSWLTGDMTLAEMLQLVFTSGIGAFLRKGISG